MRNKRKILAVTGLLLLAGVALADDAKVDHDIIPAELADNAVLLRERALLDNLSVEIVESLTTEVGPRRVGTAGDKRAIAWAEAKFKELGFDRVWTEEVPVEHGWIRGEAKAEIVSPYPHNIVMTALGYSVGTNGDLVGEIVEFADFEALEAVPEGDSLQGKIAFVSYSMADYVPEPGESRMAGYGKGTRARGAGHVAAAKRGAAAIIIRSVGTDNNRIGHTGSGFGYVDDVKRIPAAAVSAPDAILIQNMLRRGEPVVMKLNMTAEITGPVRGANVIGEITGRSDPDNYLVLGAHLDSWDEGTGAIDDGAGVGSMMAAAAFIGQMEQRPKRSIRVLLFAAEEIGLVGVRAYYEQHKDELDNHLLGAEVDSGGGRAHTLISGVGEESVPVIREMHKLVAPLGIAWSDANDATGASDMSVLGRAGMPALNLSQNSNDYFMYHHTPNDTFDKIIPEDMRYLTAAYATLFYLAAEMEVDFRN
ncbi:Peptidase M28 [uncultured Woeseiaceae bacterium]|uniref:Carboxypeptidase Q n=1 Tax=uncultured Woeseiaceae bacterium TaxID=1983305 RepID=A0A7D9H4M3_9GAMM|nr:Peptidase M28 [uncultured Woeseiaceae bacterium]